MRLSAGITAVVAPPSIESLLQGADKALYSAKGAGRDRAAVLGRLLGEESAAADVLDGRPRRTGTIIGRVLADRSS